jgi:RNA polymerase sigma factor (sigma-70 family)
VSQNLGVILGQLDRVFNQGTVTGLNDGRLLKRFVAERDEVAFAALVARHGPMVLGVCRRILRDEHDVEDAFQATFLVLVSRAKAIRDGDLLGPWIFGVAHRVAVRARAHAARRYVHERSLTAARAVVEPPSRDCERRELRAVLDDELARLPDPLLAPLVLCHLEGLTHEEAALRLRWPVGTVRSRLARARDKLRRRLSARGLTTEDAALTVAVASRSVTSVLLDATVRASLGFTARQATATARASATATALAKGVLQAMMISKIKVLSAAVLACVLTLGGLQTFARQLGGISAKPAAEAKAFEPQAELTRSMEKLQADLDESVRRQAEMRKELAEIRARLEALRTGTVPEASRGPARRLAEAVGGDSLRETRLLADVLKRHPGQLGEDVGWGYQLYMMDLVDGSRTLIVDEPTPGIYRSGPATWSQDGRRIVFETIGSDWPRGQLMAIDVRDDKPTFTQLGDGNAPALAPDDRARRRRLDDGGRWLRPPSSG